MVGVTASQFGSSRLCHLAPGPELPEERRGARKKRADEIMKLGAQGAPQESLQSWRYLQISESSQRLKAAAALAQDNPEQLKEAIDKEMKHSADVVDPNSLAAAQDSFARVVLQKVRHNFLETSIAPHKSQLHTERLGRFRGEVSKAAEAIGQRCSAHLQEELEQIQTDTEALNTMERARELREEARECASNERSTSAATLQRIGYLGANWQEESRKRIVGEVMGMLRKWKSHSEVSLSLCGALVDMCETGGDDFKEEMDRRGCGVLASTVADLHRDRPEVMRCALRLLGCVSIQILMGLIEENMAAGSLISSALEVLNKRAREDIQARDEIAYHGGREILDELEEHWTEHKIISLHMLNLRRRLKLSKTRSIRKQRPVVTLPPEEVIKLRACFDQLDENKTGRIGAQQIDTALRMVGMKLRKEELDKAVAEVDVGGSGEIFWPEFLWLMSKADFNIEARFTPERLAELREVFDLFDHDGGGDLDKKELKAMLKTIGLAPSDHELKQMILEVDADGGDTIGWEEFLMMMSKSVPDAENQHKLAFEFFDKSMVGSIDIEDFIETMKGMPGGEKFTMEELTTMFYQSKFENEDYHRLTYKEFVKMLMRAS
mmetsp:Transcript_70134/g.131111  ORF Transcript_70134/g.131111 Transcript_70134/m.131111 type:complete len:608 (-) Transcript_70134:147-1970(-)